MFNFSFCPVIKNAELSLLKDIYHDIDWTDDETKD